MRDYKKIGILAIAIITGLLVFGMPITTNEMHNLTGIFVVILYVGALLGYCLQYIGDKNG